MSGACMVKNGRTYSCSQCDSKGLRLKFDYCPFCGERIVMRWDGDNDLQILTNKEQK